MSQAIANLDRAAAAYWRRLACTVTVDASVALTRARDLTAEALIESREPAQDARDAIAQRLR
jgi:hypothetical protein